MLVLVRRFLASKSLSSHCMFAIVKNWKASFVLSCIEGKPMRILLIIIQRPKPILLSLSLEFLLFNFK